MHRTITRFRDQNRQLITEYGPWHPSRSEAEYWAENLREMGYHVVIESNGSAVSQTQGNNNDLAQALASMA